MVLPGWPALTREPGLASACRPGFQACPTVFGFIRGCLCSLISTEKLINTKAKFLESRHQQFNLKCIASQWPQLHRAARERQGQNAPSCAHAACTAASVVQAETPSNGKLVNCCWCCWCSQLKFKGLPALGHDWSEKLATASCVTERKLF